MNAIPYLPSALSDRFVEAMPPQTWGLIAYVLQPRDDPRFAYNYTARATREALALVADDVVERAGSYCALGNTILAAFSAGQPVRNDRDAHMRMAQLSRETALGKNAGIVSQLAPIASITMLATAGTGGPLALLGHLMRGNNVSAHFPARTMLPDQANVARMLQEPLNLTKLQQTTTNISRTVPLQPQREQVRNLLEAFVSERSDPTRSWSPSLRNAVKEIDAQLTALAITAPPQQAARLRSMREFVDALAEIVQEPRYPIANRGTYQGYLHYTHVPDFEEKMLVHELDDALGAYVLHDPHLFEQPELLGGQHVSLLYTESGALQGLEINRSRTQGRQRG